MYIKSLIVCLVVLWNDQSLSAAPSQIWPVDKKGQYTRATPINIKTLTTYPIFVTPLIQVNGFNEKATLINTGTGVETRIVKETAAFVTGGVLFNETYKYSKERYYWTNNFTGIAEHAINGIGTRLAVECYYFNKKYDTFDQAILHPDGLAILSFLIDVGPIDNPAFNLYAPNLRKLVNPGTQIPANIGPTFAWYNVLAVTRSYYSYPGSYMDENGRIYNCATVVVFPRSTSNPYLSQAQFSSTYGILKNKAGAPLTNAVQRYPTGGRPIACAQGFQVFYVPN